MAHEISSLSRHRLEVPKGWKCFPLDDLVDQGRGISYGIVQPGQHVDAGIPVVRVNNIRDGRIATRDILRISPDIETNYQRTRLHGGEVLLSLVGTLGECAVVSPHLAGWNVARAVAVIPLADNIESRWISICLQSAHVQHLMRSWATTTVQATLNLRDVQIQYRNVATGENQGRNPIRPSDPSIFKEAISR